MQANFWTFITSHPTHQNKLSPNSTNLDKFNRPSRGWNYNKNSIIRDKRKSSPSFLLVFVNVFVLKCECEAHFSKVQTTKKNEKPVSFNRVMSIPMNSFSFILPQVCSLSVLFAFIYFVSVQCLDLYWHIRIVLILFILGLVEQSVKIPLSECLFVQIERLLYRFLWILLLLLFILFFFFSFWLGRSLALFHPHLPFKYYSFAIHSHCKWQ